MTFVRLAFPSFVAAGQWFERTHTTVGKACMITIVIGLVTAFANFQVPLDLLAVLTALAVVCAVVQRLFRPTCMVEYKLIGRLDCGALAECDMAIKNSGQLPAFDLQVLGMHYELAPWRLTFAPSECTFIAHGDEWLVRGQISALRRGVHTPPPINIQTRFPLSLFRSKARARVMGEIVVYPYRPSTPPHWLQERLSEVGVEDSSRARTAALGEFAGNVEYRPGMAVRKWDYRSSARLGRAIVHQFDDAANRQVVIALDTFATPIQLERLLSLAATLVDICAQQQITVGQLHVLQDTETFDSFAATSIHEALETLALVRASSHYVEHFSHKRFEGCMMLLLLPSWDEQRARLIEDLMQENLQCQVMVIVDDDRPQPILPPEVTPVVWKLPPDCEQCL